MKIRLFFKTPDVAEYALEEAFGREPKNGFEDDSVAANYEKAKDAIDKFVKYGESVTIEIDTDTGEAKVLPA